MKLHQLRMKKRVSGDVQLLQLAEKELELKQQMAERLKEMSKDHREMVIMLTKNLKPLSDTMSSAISNCYTTAVTDAKTGP